MASADPAILKDLVELYTEDQKTTSLAQLMTDPENYKNTADEQQLAKREFIVSEGLQQFRDYYEDDPIESASFEYLDNLSNRDRIRFMSVFEDFSKDPMSGKAYAMIAKREYNPELSGINNLLLDLIDFKDRVRPLANDLSLMDVSKRYQTRSLEEVFGEETPGFTQEQIDNMTEDQKATYNGYMEMAAEGKTADFERITSQEIAAWKANKAAQ